MLTEAEELYLKKKITKEKALVNLEDKQKAKADALIAAQATVDETYDADIITAENEYMAAKAELDTELDKA